MLKSKDHEELCKEFYEFKTKFHVQQDLIRIFIHEYFNSTENQEYILGNEYISRICLNTLVNLLKEKTDENVKALEQLYFKFKSL